MPELRGKGWRVVGFCVWMLGAGIVLDNAALGVGAVLLAVGAALFAMGAVQSLRGVRAS